MLKKGEKPRSEDVLTPEDEIKDPLVLEFLGLKDQYSESEMVERPVDFGDRSQEGQSEILLSWA